MKHKHQLHFKPNWFAFAPLIRFATLWLATLVLVSVTSVAWAQVSINREFQLRGTVKTLIGDELTIIDGDGREHRLRIQVIPGQSIGLTGGDINLESPATIQVKSVMQPQVLQTGMVLQLQAMIGQAGKVGEIQSATLLPLATPPSGIEAEGLPADKTEKVPAKISGEIKSINDRRIVLNVGRHKLAPRQTITIERSAIQELTYTASTLSILRPGDVIQRLDAAQVSTGDHVVRRMLAETVGVRDSLNLSVDERLTLKYRDKSDEPVDSPREVRSQHFLVRTDISDRSISMLLEKLETMYDLLVVYFGSAPRQPIECYVVQDINKWNSRAWEPLVIQKVTTGAGVTIRARQGGNLKAVVFSSARHDVVQHEAVHSFCHLTFGDTGPLWYAEGIAEMGQYWNADSNSVTATAAVIGYLRSRETQLINTIVNAKEIEGEGWKAYAWRWSLCHFLATNPNYAKDFGRLGINLMRERSGASFRNQWRRQANQLSFEYNQFMEHLELGLRGDLMYWDWKIKPRTASTARTIKSTIQAARGWQPTGAKLQVGQTYEVAAEGQWGFSSLASALSADGAADGTGKLMGVILDENFQLSEEFELGQQTSFDASKDGHLFVRGQERMSQIGDNQGELEVSIRRKKD